MRATTGGAQLSWAIRSDGVSRLISPPGTGGIKLPTMISPFATWTKPVSMRV
ncbi:MAG TPA: hypothetical protein VJQ79_10305 [Acidimicrobiia bacterium]|nr:hypothetical protein [Acidimicrobiia bacterium]